MATFISHNADETAALGEEWGRTAQPGWVIGLSGDLGAGKTQLIKGFARGLDIAQLEAVINVDITPDIEVHTHRVGRTGRADEAGWAFSLASIDEMGRVGRIDEMQGSASVWHPLSELTAPPNAPPLRPPMVTLQILGGRKEKIRAGDVLGALTKDLSFESAQIGKINVNEFSTYVAVERSIASEALRKLNAGKVKGKTVKVRQL